MSADDSFFRQIVDHLTEIIWTLDADCERVLYVNPAYRDLVPGRSSPPRSDLEGSTVELDDPSAEGGPRNGEFVPADLIDPGDSEGAREWLRSIREDVRAGDPQEEYRTSVRVNDVEGEEHYLETVAVPIYGDDGSVVGIAGLSSDVTDYVRHNERLREKVERLDQFASMVSHDLRSPLTVAMSNLELYRKTGQAGRLDELEASLERIETLATDLLALARGDDAVEGTTSVSLESLAREAWAWTDTGNGRLEVVDDRSIECDRSQVRTLLENLFRNSVEHGSRGGRTGGEAPENGDTNAGQTEPDDPVEGVRGVTVRVGPLPSGFYVEDDGPGIPADLRSTVFEHGTSSSSGGSGVGLTIVDRIATAHGWRISVTESEAGGARFEFTTG